MLVRISLSLKIFIFLISLLVKHHQIQPNIILNKRLKAVAAIAEEKKLQKYVQRWVK